MHLTTPTFLTLLLGSTALAGRHGYNGQRPGAPASAWSESVDASVSSLSNSLLSTKNRLVAAETASTTESLGVDDDGNPTSAWTPVVPTKKSKTTTSKTPTSSSVKPSTTSSTTTKTPTSSTIPPTTTPTKAPTMGGPAGYGNYGGGQTTTTSCSTGSSCRPTSTTIRQTLTTPIEAIEPTTVWKPSTVTTVIQTTFISTKYVTVTTTTSTPYIATKSVPFDLTTTTVVCETRTTTVPTFSLSTCTETSSFPLTTQTASECTETTSVESSFVTSSPCPETTTVTRMTSSVTSLVKTGTSCSKTSTCKVVNTRVPPRGYGGW